MLPDLTLVINLSAGDTAYAGLTTRVLSKAHRKQAKEIIIILDDTKAQHSNFYDHQKRYKEPDFTENLRKVAELAAQMQADGLADRVIKVSQYSSDKNLNKKYLNNRVKATHDFRGAPIVAYLVGFDACKTQYMVRYDGDMLLHQPSVDWTLNGINLLKQHPDCVAVSPRPSPPLPDQLADIEIDPVCWFSTRCTLFDRLKVLTTTPFVYGKYRRKLLLRKWMQKTYPPALETMLCERMKTAELKNYYLLNNNGWLLHPEQKNEMFIKMLPEIISEVGKGNYPEEQANNETLQLNAWEKFLQLTEA
jgi:hypothetical protein